MHRSARVTVTGLGRFAAFGLLAGMVLLGLIIRLPALYAGLGRDEASTYFDALPFTAAGVISTVAWSELNPPGFFLTALWMHLVGSGKIALTIPAFTFGLALIVATYALGTAVDSQACGLMAAAIASISPLAVSFSAEARPYTLAALLCSLAMVAYCKALASVHHARHLFAFTLLAICFVYVQYTGWIFVGSTALVTMYLLLRGGMPAPPGSFVVALRQPP